MTRGWFVVAASLLLVLFARPVAGQGAEDAVRAVVEAFAGGDVAGMEPHLAGRVRLELDGAEYEGVSPRQAAAEVARLLERFEATLPEPVRGGTRSEQGRAFAELVWTPLSTATGERHGFVLFLVLAPDERGWLINEIRILKQASTP